MAELARWARLWEEGEAVLSLANWRHRRDVRRLLAMVRARRPFLGERSLCDAIAATGARWWWDQETGRLHFVQRGRLAHRAALVRLLGWILSQCD